MKRARGLLLPLVLLGMQACWLGAWLFVLESHATGGGTLAPAILCFLPLGMAIFRLVRRTCGGQWRAEVLYWCAWYLLAAATARLVLLPSTPWSDPSWLVALPRAAARIIVETRSTELLLIVGSGIAWHLGRRPVVQAPDYGRLLGDFQFGLIAILAAFLASHALDVDSGGQVPLALAFFVLSLTGVALSRGEDESRPGMLVARRHFSSSLVSFITIVSVAGLLASIAVTPELISAVADGFRYLWHVVERAMAFLASLLPAPDPESMEPAAPATGDDSELLEWYRSLPMPVQLKRILYLLWCSIVLGMLVFGLWRLVGQVLSWLKRRTPNSGIELESLDAGFLSDLLALMRWLQDRVRGGFGRVAALFGFARVGADPTVTGLYLALLKWAGKKLSARKPSQSPNEFLLTLQGLLPTAHADLALMTETYVRTRYGRYSADQEDIAEMIRASQRIRNARRFRPSRTSTKEGDSL